MRACTVTGHATALGVERAAMDEQQIRILVYGPQQMHDAWHVVYRQATGMYEGTYRAKVVRAEDRGEVTETKAEETVAAEVSREVPEERVQQD